MEVGDLVQRKGTPEWKAVLVGFVSEHYAQIVWLDTGERDACSVDLLEVLNESR